jgi:tetratricopeptide (TPR) repeat protein
MKDSMEKSFFDRGIEQINQQDYQGAIASFSQEIALTPYSAEALYCRGLAYVRVGNLHGAAFDYGDALKIDNSRLEIYYARAFVRLQLENFSGALTDIEAAIVLNFNYAPAYQLRGVIQQKLARRELAISSFKKAAELYLIAKDKENCRICLEKIDRLQSKPIAPPATTLSKPPVAPIPKPSEVYSQILERAERGDILGAIADLDWSIRVDSQDYRAYSCRGIIKAKQGEIRDAIADFNRAIELNDLDLVAYRNRGRLRHQMKDFIGAQSDLDRTLELDDREPSNYIERGKLRMAMGNYEGAIVDFERAITLNPDCTEAYLQRANAYSHQEEMQKAIEDYQTAISQYSNKADWKNYEKAIASLQRFQKGNSPANSTQSSNFSFLEVDYHQLANLGALAERYYASDPVTCLIKLRQFGELLTQIVLDLLGITYTSEESQHELLQKLNASGYFPREVDRQFQELRYIGNRAVHDHIGDRPTALKNLKTAWELSVWFRRNFGGDPHFQPDPFSEV